MARQYHPPADALANPHIREVAVEVAYNETAQELDVLAVPFGRPTTVVDVHPETGKLEKYREGFDPGAFDRQFRAMSNVARVELKLTHATQGPAGFATAVNPTSEGLNVKFAVSPSHREDIQHAIENGVNEASVEFLTLSTPHFRDGVYWEQNSYLQNVALVAEGAYPGARVLAMRHEEAVQALIDEREQELAGFSAWVEANRGKYDHLK